MEPFYTLRSFSARNWYEIGFLYLFLSCMGDIINNKIYSGSAFFVYKKFCFIRTN